MMAQRDNGRVIHLHLGGTASPSSQRLLVHLLDRTEGVVGYTLDPDHMTLTAYLDATHVDDRALVKALVASGMFPHSSQELGGNDKDNVHAC